MAEKATSNPPHDSSFAVRYDTEDIKRKEDGIFGSGIFMPSDILEYDGILQMIKLVQLY